MSSLKCILNLCLLAALLCLTAAAPSTRVKRQNTVELLQLEDNNNDADLNPINAEEVIGVDLERNKRKLPDATFEAKNAVLGFVFGIQRTPNRIQVKRALGAKKDDDAVDLQRSNVSFELPDELFNKSFQTVTNVSKTVSRLIMNSARRYSRFVLFFKPLFGDALVVKGSEDPTTTTTTTSRPSNANNEV